MSARVEDDGKKDDSEWMDPGREFEYVFTDRELQEMIGMMVRRWGYEPFRWWKEESFVRFAYLRTKRITLLSEDGSYRKNHESLLLIPRDAEVNHAEEGGTQPSNQQILPETFSIPRAGLQFQPHSNPGVGTSTNRQASPASEHTKKPPIFYKNTLFPQREMASKQTVSHSLVEKQRRDRINSLIDELRELVPPQEPLPGDMSDSKRPKHIVLSDTIVLLKRLLESTTSKATDVTDLGDEKVGTRDSSQVQGTNPNPRDEEHGTSRAGVEAPHEEGLLLDGVTVEEKEGCIFIKINCKDRRGLLSDIITHLKRMPLEIRSAAVTTTSDSCVMDVFEVVLDADSGLTAQDVQYNMQAILYSTQVENAGDKRRRPDEDE